MKRIFLTAAGLFTLVQIYCQKLNDSTGFGKRKLKIEEINLVSSYYNQNGDNAAVTGGIGSQKLTDLSNILDIKLSRYDKKLRKHIFEAEIGIDHYTSASSDKIDLKANSSASHADTRIYPSLTWTVENEAKGRSFSAGVSSSSEYDYQSYGVSLGFSKKTRNRSGEFSARLQAYFDQVKLITPVELRAGSDPDNDVSGTSGRNSFSASLSYSQIINQRLQLAFLVDVVKQQGLLSLPFYRVIFNNGTVHQELLPDNRTKIPIGIRANYFMSDKIVIRSYYRFYTDDWGVKSHTANIEMPVKISPFLSVSPFYRFYTQSGADYFAPYQKHTEQDKYYTSNYDLSKFNSHFIGAGLRLSPLNGVFGIQHFNMMEIRYGHYLKNINLNSNIISLNLKFK